MRLLLDANLGVLLVAGLADPTLPGKHKRLRDFGVRGFQQLLEHLSGYESVVFTPNVLTEVSNLVVYGLTDPRRARTLAILKEVIESSVERYAPSASAAARPEFARLGLTDAGLLDVWENGDMLLTDDDALYAAAAYQGYDAVNFKHLQAEL